MIIIRGQQRRNQCINYFIDIRFYRILLKIANDSIKHSNLSDTELVQGRIRYWFALIANRKEIYLVHVRIYCNLSLNVISYFLRRNDFELVRAIGEEFWERKTTCLIQFCLNCCNLKILRSELSLKCLVTIFHRLFLSVLWWKIEVFQQLLEF